MRKQALLIGINDYPLLGDLRYAEEDAEAVADSLQRNYSFDETEIILMTTKKSGKYRPSLPFIESQLRYICDVCRNLDFFLVGFWGHGRLSPDQSSRYLCLPECEEENLARASLTYEMLNSYLQIIGAQNTCLILDCCQMIASRGASNMMTEVEEQQLGQFAEQTARDIKTSREKAGLSVFVPPSFAILNSCMPNQQAYEWVERKHGLFTAHLLDGMDKKLDSTGRWASYVSKQVSLTACIMGKHQTPIFKQSGAGDIVLTELIPRENPSVEQGPSSVFLPVPEVPTVHVVSVPWYIKPEKDVIQEKQSTQRRRGSELVANRHSSSLTRLAGERRVIIINGIKYAFCWCPPGQFMMGSPIDEEERDTDEMQHEVIITEGFWMLETPVTQLKWKGVMGKNPSKFKDGNLPVESVSWWDCQEYLEKLNSFIDFKIRFRLPSEAEWEYACRAGTKTPFHFGCSLNGKKANCNGNRPYGAVSGPYIGKTTPVKKYESNAWGLYDMHGNVSEWCEDWYGEYPTGRCIDPHGPEVGSQRVSRGGAWLVIPKVCRSANRYRFLPEYRYNDLGLRLVLVRSLGEEKR